MPQSTETEIKLVASPSMLCRLREHSALAAAERTQTLRTTYFDTAGRRLGKNGASLRIRETEAAPPVQTLKLVTAAGAVRRREWTTEIADDVPEVAAFARTPKILLRRLTGGVPMHPFAVIETTRTIRTIRRGRSEIEVAFDVGVVRAGDRRLEICELELELVRGRLADVIALASELPLGPDLRWSAVSKAERGELLAFDLALDAQRARQPALRPAMDAAQGFAAIGWSCLGQLLANHEAVLMTGDAEAVHQARVAVRRLRVAVRGFRRIVEDDAGGVLGAELKAAAQMLGKVRDLDVLIARVLAARPICAAASAELIAELAARRAQALAAVRSMLAGDAFQHLLFAIATWLESGDWRRRKPGGFGPALLPDHAARVLSRWLRKLHKRSARLDELADRELHRVRKDAKTLRYFAEFLAGLDGDGAAGIARVAFVDALAAAQDALGAVQDAAAARSIGEDVFAAAEPLDAARLQEELRQLLDGTGVRRKKKLKQARRSLKAAWDSPAWWLPVTDGPTN